ncbi:hypothetical protein LEP1GSC047_4019 [Leptospira inadai serovar Lyme str. 10]|uniref:Lipoprotein n=2 Tax=Leptospira inadai serovar Lyme TaxID=293084 RepID=V6HCX0_9LEPT|nr:hypothetical protein [Leptospira inadai]EQA37582.1 hypothetical protein LEP1GSC047_4019 [Leptospira inadai serovar Lyme str. 10]PNV71898.1 hypothetical protein BES34_020580 [Leptospira inadai serovar Lyme]
MIRIITILFLSTSPLLACDFFSDWTLRVPNAEESLKIESLKFYIQELNSNRLHIDKSFYRRKSNFRKLFGFSFSGADLSAWLNSRIKVFKMGPTGKYIAYFHDGMVVLGKDFFTLPKVEQALVLIHEARHADGREFTHSKCPEGFPYVSLRSPKIPLENTEACDDRVDGSYGFGAAFLFEIYAFGLYQTGEERFVLGLYNSEIARIVIPESNHF